MVLFDNPWCRFEAFLSKSIHEKIHKINIPSLLLLGIIVNAMQRMTYRRAAVAGHDPNFVC